MLRFRVLASGLAFTRKDEDEVEKELERRDPLLALDRLCAHERTLTRFASSVRPPSGSDGSGAKRAGP
jgi:hypothetical protein